MEDRLAGMIAEMARASWSSTQVVKLHYKLAAPTGFEPALSTLTGSHARPLHHGAALTERGYWER